MGPTCPNCSPGLHMGFVEAPLGFRCLTCVAHQQRVCSGKWFPLWIALKHQPGNFSTSKYQIAAVSWGLWDYRTISWMSDRKVKSGWSREKEISLGHISFTRKNRWKRHPRNSEDLPEGIWKITCTYYRVRLNLWFFIKTVQIFWSWLAAESNNSNSLRAFTVISMANSPHV